MAIIYLDYRTVAIKRRGTLQFGGALTQVLIQDRLLFKVVILMLKKHFGDSYTPALIQDRRSFKTKRFIPTVQ